MMSSTVIASIFLTRRVLTLVVFTLLALMTVGVLVASAAGSAQARGSPFLEAGDCPQPCWQDLRPGYSAREETLSILQRHPDTIASSLEVHRPNPRAPVIWAGWEMRHLPLEQGWLEIDGPTLVTLELFLDGSLPLSDAVAVFGEPSRATLCLWEQGRARSWQQIHGGTFAVVYFRAGAVEVWAYDAQGTVPQIRPDMQIHSVIYRAAPGRADTQADDAAAWHGFGRANYEGDCRTAVTAPSPR